MWPARRSWHGPPPVSVQPDGRRIRPPRPVAARPKAPWPAVGAPAAQDLDAVFHLVRTGCRWHSLPREFPPWPTVHWWFRCWRLGGTWRRLNASLAERVRVASGRQTQPTAAMMDSQSVKTTSVGGVRGFDGAKKLTGRKRHVLVDPVAGAVVLPKEGEPPLAAPASDRSRSAARSSRSRSGCRGERQRAWSRCRCSPTADHLHGGGRVRDRHPRAAPRRPQPPRPHFCVPAAQAILSPRVGMLQHG